MIVMYNECDTDICKIEAQRVDAVNQSIDSLRSASEYASELSTGSYAPSLPEQASDIAEAVQDINKIR